MPKTSTQLAILRIITDERYLGISYQDNIGKMECELDTEFLREQLETHGINKILIGIANFTSQLIKLNEEHEKTIKKRN